MFDTSFPEMLVIFVIALLVLGPERLPRVARTIGLWVGRARATFSKMRTELEREVNFQELQDAQRELRASLSASEKALSENVVKPITEAVESVPQEIEKNISPSVEQSSAVENKNDDSKQATP